MRKKSIVVSCFFILFFLFFIIVDIYSSHHPRRYKSRYNSSRNYEQQARKQRLQVIEALEKQRRKEEQFEAQTGLQAGQKLRDALKEQRRKNDYLNALIGQTNESSDLVTHMMKLPYSAVMLIVECERNNITEAKDFVKDISDINVKTNHGYTPLCYVARYSNPEAINILINAGADVNARDNNGVTPLFYAVMCLNLEGIKFLLGAGADVNAKDKNGITPLILAVASTSNPERILDINKAQVKNKGYSDIDAKIEIEVIKTLIDAGADVNVNFNDKNLLDYTQNEEIKQLLINARSG